MTHLLQSKTFTVDEYYKLAEVGILKDTDKVELIDGRIINKNAITSQHAGMLNRLTRKFIELLSDKFIVRNQSPIRLNNQSEPEPDVTITKYCRNNYFDNHPTPEDVLVVVEVSDSTLEKDRTIKVPLYAMANIPEYWIINLVDKQIEIYRQPKKGAYHFKQIISEKDQVIEVVGLSLKFKYQEIFIED